jgi:hypothetical protein
VSVLVPEMPLQVVEKLKITMAKIFPNPFNPRVEYYLAKESRISIQVFDMQGKKIRTIQYGMMPPGNYSVNWDLCNNSGSKVGNGSYVISVHVGEETISKNLFIVQ